MPFLVILFLFLATPLWATDDQEISQELYDLTSRRAVGSTDMVEVLLETAGATKMMVDEKETTGPLKVMAGFKYEERILDFQTGEKPNLKSIREYSLARAKMEFGETIQTPDLSTNHRFVVCQISNGKRASLFSPQGPLKNEQLLLIEGIMGNTLGLDLLLPPNPVKIGDSWDIPDAALLSFLDVDGVSEQALEATLLSVVDDLAMIQIVGDAQGAYLGAYCEMTVNAKYQFDLLTGRINWVGMLLEEKRSIGIVGPGLDIKARLQVKILPLDAPNNLTNELIKTLDLRPNESVSRLRFENERASWRFQHPRSWYIIPSGPNQTFLRMLDKGELVAQCNIVAMPKIDPKKPKTLREFAADLVEGLEKASAKVVSMDESMNSAGYHELRVILDGKVDKGPQLRWVYFLLTDKNGFQTVIVFVIEADHLHQFGDSDDQILDSFRMIN